MHSVCCSSGKVGPSPPSARTHGDNGDLSRHRGPLLPPAGALDHHPRHGRYYQPALAAGGRPARLEVHVGRAGGARHLDTGHGRHGEEPRGSVHVRQQLGRCYPPHSWASWRTCESWTCHGTHSRGRSPARWATSSSSRCWCSTSTGSAAPSPRRWAT